MIGIDSMGSETKDTGQKPNVSSMSKACGEICAGMGSGKFRPPGPGDGFESVKSSGGCEEFRVVPRPGFFFITLPNPINSGLPSPPRNLEAHSKDKSPAGARRVRSWCALRSRARADAEPSLVQRLRDALIKRLEKKKEAPPRPGEWEFSVLYQAPSDALISFVSMATEGAQREIGQEARFPNRNFALWCLRNRPHVFGQIHEVDDVVIRKEKLADWAGEQSLRLSNTVESQPIQPILDIKSWKRRVRRDKKKMRHSLLRLAGLIEAETGNLERARQILREVKLLEGSSEPRILPASPLHWPKLEVRLAHARHQTMPHSPEGDGGRGTTPTSQPAKEIDIRPAARKATRKRATREIYF